MEQQQVDEDIDAPLVFQCSQCREIIGDTFAWICSDQELNTITLSSMNCATDDLSKI